MASLATTHIHSVYVKTTLPTNKPNSHNKAREMEIYSRTRMVRKFPHRSPSSSSILSVNIQTLTNSLFVSLGLFFFSLFLCFFSYGDQPTSRGGIDERHAGEAKALTANRPWKVSNRGSEISCHRNQPQRAAETIRHAPPHARPCTSLHQITPRRLAPQIPSQPDPPRSSSQKGIYIYMIYLSVFVGNVCLFSSFFLYDGDGEIYWYIYIYRSLTRCTDQRGTAWWERVSGRSWLTHRVHFSTSPLTRSRFCFSRQRFSWSPNQLPS